MEICLIAAMAKNRVIGCHNRLPWHIPADLNHFKQITLNQTIVMGRKTYESIGRPLPKRENIVISRQTHFHAPGCLLFHSLEEAIEKKLSQTNSLFIIGGASLYQEALPLASKLFFTLIDAEIKGDTFFPKIDFTKWQEISREEHAADEKNPYPYCFVNYII